MTHAASPWRRRLKELRIDSSAALRMTLELGIFFLDRRRRFGIIRLVN